MKKLFKCFAAIALMASATLAQASLVFYPTANFSNVKAADVSLNGKASTAFATSTADKAVLTFNSTGTGPWKSMGYLPDLFNQVTDSTKSFRASLGAGSVFDGSWSFTNLTKQSETLDLAVVLYGDNSATTFMFDNLTMKSGETMKGLWDINWGTNFLLGYTNDIFTGMGLYVRDAGPTPTTAVPEPASFALMGLGLLSLGAFRRKAK